LKKIEIQLYTKIPISQQWKSIFHLYLIKLFILKVINIFEIVAMSLFQLKIAIGGILEKAYCLLPSRTTLLDSTLLYEVEST
jgi:hypothetical protein